ncbi:alpha/beta-Hydrolases superfamily protein [Actinidia rufa]|uniref:Alpha/beta-Hydrolases superfamily protein n=1 Tax=Actinidia rufa TaxID=165716 RepID=A0A7J0GCF4_9ERIC|nr:alpha/beta-Hydrolases superfamily protein [Actinidia rufa]
MSFNSSSGGSVSNLGLWTVDCVMLPISIMELTPTVKYERHASNERHLGLRLMPINSEPPASCHYALDKAGLVPAIGNPSPSKWFDVGDISEDAPDDLEGLDASAAHVANLLSTEPPDIKLGVGGFSMGAATALYSATCQVFRQYANGSPYLVNLSAVVGLSGWLPCDDVVAYKHGEKSAQTLSLGGFRNLTFRTYNGLGHYTIPEETEEGENRGMQRCWLRFEDAQQNIMEFSPGLKMLSRQLINLTQPITSTMENQPLNVVDHEGETFSYCECFADRYYCYEDCACQGCVKCVEYEDTIEAAVEEIKSRNKHAFESKIVSISLILLQIGMWY